MPRAARFVVAIALLELVVTAWAGWALALARVDPDFAWAQALRALHVEAGLVGAWSGMAIGIAWWILPRPRRTRPFAPVLIAGALVLHAGVAGTGAGLRGGPTLAMAGLAVAAAALIGRLQPPLSEQRARSHEAGAAAQRPSGSGRR